MTLVVPSPTVVQMRELLVLILLYLGLLTSYSTQSDIRMPPTITRSTTGDWIYRADERITLVCETTGSGLIKYQWTRNGSPLNLNRFEKFEVVGEGQSFTIKHASLVDNGYYQCIASNDWGSAMSNISFLQLATVGESPPSLDIPEKRVVEGKPFKIRAQPHKSFPRPTYSWEVAQNRDDSSPRKLILDARMQMDDEGNLHFAYAIPDDAQNNKIYKLVTFNQHLDQKLGGSYTRIIVDPPTDGNTDFAPLRNTSFPETDTYTGLVGQNITLRCFFAARPEAKYDWTFPEASKRTRGKSENTELFIRDIEPRDEGKYVCTGWNSVGRTERTLRLDVQAAPVFKSLADRPRNINVTEGETATFRCKSEGEPASTTVWYMNGVKLDVRNTPPRIRFSSNDENLIVENVCRDCDDRSRSTDLMVIQCNTSNTHGYALGTGYLNVLKKTTVISLSEENYVEVDQDEAKVVKFKCKAVFDPSTPVTVEWRKVDPNEPERDYPVYPDNKFIILDKEELRFEVDQNNTAKWWEIEGQYRCRANNSYSSDTITMTLSIRRTGIASMLWIIPLIVALLLLLIIVLCCCIYQQRNSGDSYPVDEKERLNGNDPEKEIEDSGFQDYRRPETLPSKSNGGSMSSTVKLNSEDESSLNDYGSMDPGKFTEDGSFVGAYTGTVDRKKGRYE